MTDDLYGEFIKRDGTTSDTYKMTDDLVVRLRTHRNVGRRRKDFCVSCGENWPCMAIRAADEIEHLTAENGALGNQMSGMSDELLDQERQIERLRQAVNDAAELVHISGNASGPTAERRRAWLARWENNHE